MKDRLVTSTVAKLAKELGYRSIFTHYYVDDFDGFESDGKLRECQVPRFINYKESPNLIGVPTQSMLNQWLRKKYHLYLSVASNSLTVHFPMLQQLEIGGSTMKGPPYLKHFKNYEDALDDGLEYTLKLIKENTDGKDKRKA